MNILYMFSSHMHSFCHVARLFNTFDEEKCSKRKMLQFYRQTCDNMPLFIFFTPPVLLTPASASLKLEIEMY